MREEPEETGNGGGDLREEWDGDGMGMGSTQDKGWKRGRKKRTGVQIVVAPLPVLFGFAGEGS